MPVWFLGNEVLSFSLSQFVLAALGFWAMKVSGQGRGPHWGVAAQAQLSGFVVASRFPNLFWVTLCSSSTAVSLVIVARGRCAVIN